MYLIFNAFSHTCKPAKSNLPLITPITELKSLFVLPVTLQARSVAACNGVQHCNTCNENATEILKIPGDRPKVNKSGLKRALGAENPGKKQKYREDIMADSYYFGKKDFGVLLYLRTFPQISPLFSLNPCELRPFIA